MELISQEGVAEGVFFCCSTNARVTSQETWITTTQQGELQILNYHAPSWPSPRRPFGCRDDGCSIALYKSTMLRTRESAGRRPRKEPPPYLRLGKSAVSGDPHAPLPQWPKKASLDATLHVAPAAEVPAWEGKPLSRPQKTLLSNNKKKENQLPDCHLV